jgi:hypothetical protein
MVVVVVEDVDVEVLVLVDVDVLDDVEVLVLVDVEDDDDEELETVGMLGQPDCCIWATTTACATGSVVLLKMVRSASQRGFD